MFLYQSSHFLDSVMFDRCPVTRPNYSVSKIPNVNVTTNAYRNIYAYSQSILWTAYGLALGVSLLSVISGVVIYFVNHGSNKGKFTTMLRTTRTADVTTELSVEDAKGMDPVPDHIADVAISFHDVQGQNLGKEMASVESNTETEPHEAPRTPEILPEPVAEPIVLIEVAEPDNESGSDQVSRPSSWFIGTQQHIMYHGANH